MGHGSHRWELAQAGLKAPDDAGRAAIDEGLEAQVLADPSQVEIGLHPGGESSGIGVYLDAEGRQAVVTVAGGTVDDAAVIEAMWAAARAEADREDGPHAPATRAIVVGRSVDPSLTPMTQWLSRAGVPVTVRVLEPAASRPTAVDDVEEEADRSLLPLGDLYPWLRQVPDVVLAEEADLREVAVPARVLSALRYGGHITCGDLAEATLRDVGDAPHTGGATLAALQDVLQALEEAGAGQPAPVEDVPQMSAYEIAASWISGLPARSADVLRRRVLVVESTLEEVGRGYGVSRERIRQLERGLVKELDEFIAAPEWRPVREWGEQFTEDNGTWLPSEPLDGVEADEPGQLLRRLAGYEEVLDGHQWVLRKKGATLPSLKELQWRAGGALVLDAAATAQVLQTAGIRGDAHDAYLAHLGLEHRSGAWVRWPDSFVERAILLLELHGEPMDPDELAGEVGSASARSVRQRLFDDDRVQRVGRSLVGLRAWGLPEYTTTAGVMEAVLTDHGGEMLVSELADELEALHSIKRSTVAAFTRAPMFVRSGQAVRVRDDDEPWEFPEEIAVPAAVALAGDRVTWDVVVDTELLRGSGLSFPLAAAKFIDLRPGNRKTFPIRGCEALEVSVAWLTTSVAGPLVGSLRAAAQAVGATQGETLRITIDRVRQEAHIEKA